MDQVFQTKSFLIVDDISAMRSVTKSLLMQLGIERIHQASNGAEALKLLAKERIDVVLSDWNMPVMTGMELLNAMRSDPKLRHLPLILITAEADRARIQQAITAGVAGILIKPYTGASLAQRITRVLTPGSATPAAPADSAPAAARTKPAQATVLIVDDTPDNLTLLAGILKDDYQIRAVNSGKRALSICQSETPPDLILLDIMMPEMDGFEVAKRLREHPSSEHIPVIFVTAMTDEAAKAKGLELGAVDFVTKPVDPDGLKIRIRNFMRYIDLRRQVQADYDGMLEHAKLRESVESITKHDIKGPLAGVLGIAQELAGNAALAQEVRTKLQTIEEATLGVLDTLTRSTELYKIESGTFHLQPQEIDITALLKKQADLTQQAYTVNSLKLDVSVAGSETAGPVAIAGDTMLCRSVLQNLLKNACEAAPANSKIDIVIHPESPVRIVIRNPGAVPVAMRECFFDKFATSGKERGSGLGTYSAKMMTEAQRGTIAMETSDEANQTSITLTFPAYSGQG